MHAFCSIDQFGQFLQNILHMNIQISNEHLRHEYIRVDHYYVKYVKYVDVLNNRDVGFLVEVKDGDGDVDK